MTGDAHSILPRILPPIGAIVKDVFRQLRSFERLPRAEQEGIQARQLRHLLAHAREHSPFWADRIARAGIDPSREMTLADLIRLPPLTRTEVQANFEGMRARDPSWNEADIITHSTSGSTGQPVRLEKLRWVYRPLYDAVTQIDHTWQGRDARRTLGVYRTKGTESDTGVWGPPSPWFGRVGRAYQRQILGHPVEELYEALERHRPSYVFAGPTMLAALARVAQEQGRPVPQVEQFLTFSEQVTDQHRALARDVFGARITDRYSSEECGWLALQCPKHDHYHAMSAVNHLEVVDDAGQPCRPGEPGRVLVTSLHSYAMPLLRYEIGDMAELGEACDCGITLPVIARIRGRIRDVVILPNGQRQFVNLNLGGKIAGTEVLEHQTLLYSCDTVEVIVRCRGPLTEDTREALVKRVLDGFGYPFRVVVRQTDQANWLGLHKRREFEKVDRPYAEATA